MKIDRRLTAAKLLPAVHRLLDLTAPKILDLDRSWDAGRGTPVFTRAGRYTTRGWTEWTQGFQYGCALLQYDMTGESRFLEIGRRQTIDHMAPHVSHVGVHDHGFNNLSTYGNLRRLMLEGRLPFDQRELELYELAIKV
ncbi:MAG: glycosyl hydrolase, partial [Gemmatimonadota bacterium]